MRTLLRRGAGENAYSTGSKGHLWSRPLACVLLLSYSAAAQQPTPTFSANSNLVIVDITVRDKAGKPIEGLKQDDFTVLEDGKPQKVTVFEYQRLTMDTEPPPP